MTTKHLEAETADLLELALSAARVAGGMLLVDRPADLGVAATKSSPTDVVTEMDTAAEKLIVDFLRARRPHDGFLGEEGAGEAGESGIRWVVDPIDGTVNYLYGLPAWCVSIAAEDADGAIVGVVEVPTQRETFHAVRGGGAFRNGVAVRANTGIPMDRALVATGFGYTVERRTRQAEVVRQLLPAVRDIRRYGSAAIDLCALACGRVDAYYERGLNPWDVAAGGLIAAEAGASVGVLRVEDDGSNLVVGAASPLYEELAATLEQLGA
ncbi:inositol monophosphatase family protein [Yinghuangia seranimata]|uniref:inositol monophosphatase family protein n=1 Tax=Yinghuangia seranimata TaxID=408067 RepID=UPI00248CFCBD|nr:inositol monophosphatase family protein [Yinghuangia seranimata]MDI2128704.1 inositol monophosphatase family protein [Yinghuangia seranimata]